ncbi:ABC transporter substrate-binding protein [Ramlibacter sp. H39-3-26]|uniref:ABC transporter substrate-binding protein n=1 Tax=Curvibacter soli TaxID=3031331 RepID=UPI0023DBA2A2|nr:ABC transporter substrate-binding protein [Ramlibacter sp. H39-3-26]MDF1484951.1 ABC transporter substrate-binding protein [Ramlibacter sp. H39-3-26]
MDAKGTSRRRFVARAGGAALVAGFGLAHAQSEKIVLGQSAAFTGPSAQLGLQFNAGARLYFDQLNAQGGVGRRLIEIARLDDGYEPDRCAENTRKFIADDVFALFGYIGTPTTLAALPLLTQARIPLLAPFTGAMALREPFNRNVFHVRASYNDETALIVRQLTGLGITRIGVFHQNDSYGKAGLDGVTLALAAQNLKPAGQATVERNSNDVAAAVKTLVAAQLQAIVLVSTYGSCAAFIRAARAAGYGGTFYNVSFVGTQALADALGKDGAGVVVSQVVPSPYQPSKPITREFLDAIRKGGGAVQPNYSSLEGYIAARVCAEGLRQAGDKPTREGFVRGLEAISPQHLPGFPITYGSANHAGSKFVEISMLTGDGGVRT